MPKTWLDNNNKFPISILQSREIQRITGLSSNIVSPVSKFRLLFDGKSTDYIFADPLKNGDCKQAAVDVENHFKSEFQKSVYALKLNTAAADEAASDFQARVTALTKRIISFRKNVAAAPADGA